MLRWVILAVAWSCLTAAATLVPLYLPDPEAAPKATVNASTGPQPKVEIDQALIYDFGKMSQHDKGMHTWRIKNTGEATLELWMIGKPTCSCTIAKLENNQKATVKPGKSTTIDLEWNTKDFHDDYSQGAKFGTNAPLHPTFNLTIKGKVHPPVVVFPPEMIQFPTISNEEPHAHPYRGLLAGPAQAEGDEGDDLEAGPDRRRGQADDARGGQALKVEAGYSVIVEIKPGMPAGPVPRGAGHPDRPSQAVRGEGVRRGQGDRTRSASSPRVADARCHQPGGGFA